MSRKAKYRNSDEDGQDDVRGNNAYYRFHVYQVTRTTFCENKKTQQHMIETQKPNTHIIHEQRVEARYLAVLLMSLREKE